MGVTYPPEFLPKADKDEEAEIVIVNGFQEWQYRIAELKVIDGNLWARLEERDLNRSES